MKRVNNKLFDKMAGVKLDVGAGPFKQAGFIGMDRVKLRGVDIVHDIQKFPWPIPNNICSTILMSHVWEHVEPKYRSRLMDECWRIIRYDGQLLISAPYANTFLANAHPEHYQCPNELTFQFYDPRFNLFKSGSYGMVKPWTLIRNEPNVAGCIEVILEPCKDAKGKKCLPKKLVSEMKSLWG